jgi:hypothetical protein
MQLPKEMAMGRTSMQYLIAEEARATALSRLIAPKRHDWHLALTLLYLLLAFCFFRS